MKYQNLIGHINADINTNGNHAITGAKLNSALNEIVSVLGDGYRIAGLAHIGDQAPNPAENGMCYIAMDEGTYVNFGNVARRGDELVLIYYDGSAWQKMAIRNKTFGYVEIRNNYTVLSSSEMDELRKDFAIIFDVRTDNKDVYFKCQHKADGEDHDSMTFRTMPDIRISISSNAFSLLMNVITVGYNSDSGMYFALLDTQTSSKEVYDANAVDWFLARKQNTLTFDTVPTDGSSNPVTSGGVEKAISEIQSSLAAVATSGSYNDLENKPDIPNVSGKADKVSDATQGNLAALDSSGNLTDSGIFMDDVQIIPPTFTDGDIIVFDKAGYIEDSGISYNNIIRKSQTSGLLKNDGTIDTTNYGTYSKPSGGIPASDIASGVIPTVPVISTDIETDKASDVKTASPKAVYDEVHPATGSSQPSGGMLPNKLYKLGTLSGSVTISLAAPADANIENEYRFTFTADSTAPTITWPNTVTKWIGNSLDNGAPKVEASTYYEVSIQDGYGIFNAF